MDEVKDRVRRALERLEPTAGGLEKTMRRVRRRERNRRIGAGAVGIVLMAGLAVGLWVTLDSRPRQPVGSASPRPAAVSSEDRLFLAGDGEMWVVEVGTGSVRHLLVPQLSPGDPPYRIVRRGEKLVVWGYKTYLIDPETDLAPRVLVEDSTTFIPSAAPDRVWIAIGGPGGHLAAVREVSVDGRITVPDTKPPEGSGPVAALEGGLVLQLPDGRLEVWDPLTGEVLRRLPGVRRRLPGAFPVASYGNLLAWCSDLCETLHLTHALTGDQVEVSPPAGTHRFEPHLGAFSPDGRYLAVAVHTDPVATARKLQLALVETGAGTATRVLGTDVEGYVFVDWSPSGEAVFISGGERFEDRTLIEYRLGSRSAERIPADVGDFYGMAAA